MAIQFLCSACGQPIEVDDDMANLTVTCPYCRKVVTTPAQSSLTARPDVPTPGSVPVLVPGAAAPVPQPFAPVLTPPPRKSVLGWIALACMGVSIVCVIYTSVVTLLAARDFGIEEIKKPESFKAFQEELQKRHGLQIVAILGSCALPVAGALCAIIALAIRARPRWPAITALCLIGAMILLSCAGIILQAMAAKPPTG